MMIKVCFVLITISFATSLNLEPDVFSLGPKPEAVIAQIVTRGIQWHIRKEIEKNLEKRPIISPIEDPLIIPELIKTPINIVIPEIISIIGNFFIGETEIAGLSGLEDDFRLSVPIVVIPLNVNWTMDLPNATFMGPFTVDGNIESPQTGGSLKIEGTGDAVGSVESVFFRLNAIGRAPAYGYMELSHLDVDLGFENLILSFDGLIIGGEPVDPINIGVLIQTIFDSIWTDKTRPVVNEMIRCSLNHTVSDCNVQQLIQGFFGCLKLPDPKCFGDDGEIPSTTIESETEESNEPATNEPTTPAAGGAVSFQNIWPVSSFLTAYLLHNMSIYIFI